MATIPKLALLPSGVKATKVYSVLPTDGTGDFTFDRNLNTATRVNSQGLIEMVAEDVPRLNYPLIDGVVQGCPSLLLEPERTNNLQRSEEFDNASWVKNRITETPNAITAPNGTLTADLLDTNANGPGSSVTQNITSVLGTRYNISVFVKRNNTDFLLFNIVNNAFTNGVRIWFNINTKTISSTLNVGLGLSVSNTLIEEYADDWLRLSTSVVADDGLIRTAFFITNANGVFSSTIGDKVYIWGAQLEAGTYATSYIPTTSAIATRSAETCNGAGDASTFNDSEGVLFAEISALANDGTFRAITLSDGSLNNNFILYFTQITNQVRVISQSSGVRYLDSTTLVSDITNNNKIALKYKANDFALWINGIEVLTDLSGLTPIGLNRLNFNVGTGVEPFYGNVKQIQYFNTSLTDQELQQLTTL